MSFFIFIVLLSVSVNGIFSQLGIKTHHVLSPSSSENLIQNSSSIIHDGQGHHPNRIFWNGTHFADEKTYFLNKTHAEMAPGICFKEVPTATLVKNADQIPAGNGSDPSLSRIQVCCEGYERNMHNFRKCDPICSEECINGICVAPNICSCFPDHVQNLGKYCIPTCPIGCGNGKCQPDGSCLCEPGYVLETRTQKFCIPYCSQGCQNGNCTAPNTCTCDKRYHTNSEGKCIPKCDNCENGECISPGVCSCKKGYVRKEDRCEPICTKGCNNGFCSAPDICSCRPGFTLDPTGTNCLAHCDQPCLNGYCSGSNTCSCNEGYILDEFNPVVCKPHCPGGCPNGYCTSPNFCICKPGYIKTGVKGKQNCIPV